MTAEAIPLGVVIVILSARSLEVAQKISAVLPESEIHGRSGRVQGVEQLFFNFGEHARNLFELRRPIICICAAGIVIRALSTVLCDKNSEPPVIVVSDDGKNLIPLLGGHHGANFLASYLAALIGANAVITTVGDVAFGVVLDSPGKGWKLANPEKAKLIMVGLLSGQTVNLQIEGGDGSWLTSSRIPFSSTGTLRVKITHKAIKIDEEALTYYPSILVLGIGCERNTKLSEMIELVDSVLKREGLAREAIACVASIDIKMDENAIHGVADYFGVPARFFSAEELDRQKERLANPSMAVFKEVGCHGVSEGAALAAAGDDGVLLVEKTKSKRATVALAKAKSNIDIELCGKGRGRLNIVGIGPGHKDWRTPAAARAIMMSSHIVGYSLYLDLISDLLKDKICYSSELSEEIDRVRKALDLAGDGETVALVCSGDAGIYALATLVFELIHKESRPEWNRIAIKIEPGISAIQAAAARAGAPLGNDFCAISLSDLLTPWKQIERRLKAAVEGDFIVAIYNPASKRRQEQLERAKAIFLSKRLKNTPVVLARNLGREEESIKIIELADLSSHMVDMLTIIIVGNSQTCSVNFGEYFKIYTPRGYSSKFKIVTT